MIVRKAMLSSLGMLMAVVFGAALQVQATPQPQQGSTTPSVADAARKARAEKKDQAKPAKVYTNDDLAEIKGAISVVGTAPAPPAEPSTAAVKPDDKTGDKTAAKEDAKGETYWRDKFADARRKLADDSKELDVLQREFNLKQQQYYSDPNVAMREQNNRKDLDDSQQLIDAKKQAVNQDQQAISDLQDDLRKAGGNPGWASAP